MLLTNLQIHQRNLPKEEMVSITGTEECVVEGDYLAWGEMEWKVGGLATTWTSTTTEELCSQRTFVRFLPEREIYSGAVR